MVVADHGAALFEVPQEWVAVPDEGGHLCLHDRPPPDDACRLEFSLLPVPGIISAGPPLGELLDQATGGDDVDEVSRSAPVAERRNGLELVWNEICHPDAATGALALTRTCLARGGGIHAVLSMTLWAGDLVTFDPVWHEVLRSLVLGRPVDLSGRDPRRN